ncbi:RNA polymerase recycling motor HelD [Bacillus massilinigeriensis]|uniref:RNA polymerase recycling motor HelD n=1 Tax=Bacillus massilionigeriensis TaxID=1805475 RepID=UPI00096ADFCB|nr:RNA polymerase recycling motor HelD [Bacillus massilionigeriensis]
MDQEKIEMQQEKTRVDSVISEVDRKINQLETHVQKVGSDVQEIRKSFWQDVTVNLDELDDVIETFTSIKQQAELLSERERNQGHIKQTIKTLHRLKNSPYFGRIDFQEDQENEMERIYIGITSLLDNTEENFLIYDWRAPISSMYYDYSPGPSKYEIMDGTVTGLMTLKRQYIIRDGRIEGMFDTGVTIGDEMLREVLGNNANTQMKSIVSTIQKEQNQIIRNEKSKVLLVQGVAGSGKTSAAMQRIAYLLYRYRNTIKSENIMLFSPNPLFNSYVATVLPELGEENMRQGTFQEYINHRLAKKYRVEDPFMQMEYLLSTRDAESYETRVHSIQFKASLQFKGMIDDYAKELSKDGLSFRNISFRGKTLISSQQIKDYFYSLNQSYSIPNRIVMVKDWLLMELRKFAKLENKADWVKEEIQFLSKEDLVNAYKALQKNQQFTEETFDDFDQEELYLSKMVVNRYFKTIVKKVKNLEFIHMKKLYSELFRKENWPNQPNQWSDICQITLKSLAKSSLNYEDTTPYMYLQDLIEGRRTNSGIRHVFIDEAQDYSAFQFAYIKQIFPYSKLTLLGDMNQAIYSHTLGKTLILSDAGFEQEEIDVVTLTKSYRSTKPIVEFTKRILAGGEEIEAFNREGKTPTVTKVSNKDDQNRKMWRKIAELEEEGHQTIAVICKTAKESKEAYEAFANKEKAWLIEKGTITFEKGILFIPSYLAKGIEFDAVIIHDASLHQYYRESERKLFYTACTRAMHELHLISVGEYSPFFANLEGYFDEMS